VAAVRSLAVAGVPALLVFRDIPCAVTSLVVGGMSCEANCGAAVVKALSSVHGVQGAAARPHPRGAGARVLRDVCA
jgi:hypothetical protein